MSVTFDMRTSDFAPGDQSQKTALTNGHHGVKPFDTVVDEYPITVQRRPFVPAEEDELQSLGTARANIAASRERPNGTPDGEWAARYKDKTVLQQHYLYWDTDDDGVMWPTDTYYGCRAWGWAMPLAAFAAFLIHFNLSYGTVSGILPDPFFRIYLNKIHKDKQ